MYHADYAAFRIAASDTTSISLSYFFWELSRRADIMKKLQSELDQEIPDSRVIPDNSVLQNLPYLNAFITEGLLLYLFISALTLEAQYCLQAFVSMAQPPASSNVSSLLLRPRTDPPTKPSISWVTLFLPAPSLRLKPGLCTATLPSSRPPLPFSPTAGSKPRIILSSSRGCSSISCLLVPARECVADRIWR